MSRLKIWAVNVLFPVVLAAAGTASLFFSDNSEAVIDDRVSVTTGTIFRTAAYDLEMAEQLKQRMIHSFGLSQERAHKFSRWITEASIERDVPDSLLTALINAESHFREEVVSHVGAVGPAQVVPRFWSQICDGDLAKDPRANVHCGAKALSHYYHNRCDRKALCAVPMYNVGPTAFFSPSKEMKGAMQRYIAKINKGLAKLDQTQIADIQQYW